ncbi:MAG: GNAT family N-acetyltransferase [Acidimicrobiia bacterium]|nr:GNAT family N-acetyltransferase [Acidimicrobiia bacterium]
MTARVEVRPIKRDEISAFRTTISGAFGGEAQVADDPGDRFVAKLPLDRTRAVFSDGRLVATSGTFPLVMNVPGGSIRCAGTTMVSVLPTHRRRGILRSMIAALHQDAREREEPIAALWASESGIYGRFGYGAASDMLNFTIPGKRMGIDPTYDADPVTLLEPGPETTAAFRALESRDRPGWFQRSETWLEVATLRDVPEDRDGATAYRTAVTGSRNNPTGLVRYRMKEDTDSFHPGIQVGVSELWGTTPAAWAGLWGFVLGIDLITTITADIRPVDDPLLTISTEPRRAKTTITDSLWVVLLDVGQALIGRRYSAPFAATIEVRDGESSEVWRLEMDRDGTKCEPTKTSPDATMDRRHLGEAYMGRPRFSQNVRAGAIEMDPDLAAAADQAFHWHIPPFTPEIF